MTLRFLPVLLIFCGFAVTDAAARPRVAPDTVTAVESREFTLEKLGPATLSGIQLKDELGLKPGQKVEVKALPKDRYGRTPVILYKPGDKVSWQEHLLRNGQALAYDRKAVPAAWLRTEAKAPTIGPDETFDHIGEFVVVEGTVTRSYKSRDTYYINFGEDWKTDFSLRIPRKAWRSFGKDFAIADGTRLRARGALFLENGPMIELTRPQQIEISVAPKLREPQSGMVSEAKGGKPPSERESHADAQ